MTRDPVCGMEVDETESRITAQHQDQSYYFCSPQCRDEFQRNPQQFAGETTGQAGWVKHPGGKETGPTGQQPARQSEKPGQKKFGT